MTAPNDRAGASSATSSVDIAVVGGSGGITANRHALAQLSNRYRNDGWVVRLDHEALRAEARALGNPVFGGEYGSAGRLDPVGLIAACTSLDRAADQLRRAAESLDELGTKLGWAVQGYPWGETALDVGLLDTLAGLLGGPTHFGLFGAKDDAVAGQDPRTVDLAVDLLGVPRLAALVGSGTDGIGSAVGLGVASVPAPRNLADLVDGLGSIDRAGTPGGVDVHIVTGTDGRRRAIVDVTGTKVWRAGGTNPADLTTNALAINGHVTAYEQGVFAALREAGVARDEPVMVIGHSQGGMVAVNVARDAARTHEFAVTHVITAGSPVGLIVSRLPKSVQVLSLENRRDVVPRLDGVANPDRRNVVTVSGTAGDGSVGGSHAIDESYRPIAAAADRDGGRSVRDFLRSADGFLTGDRTVRHRYRIERR